MINIRYLDIRTGTVVGLAGQLGWPGNVCGTENLCQPLSLSLTTGQLLAVTRRDSSLELGEISQFNSIIIFTS